MKPAVRQSSQVSTSSTVQRKHPVRRTVVRSRSSRRKLTETELITETTLKLFLSLLVTLVATISFGKLLPYHFAQSGKLKELRAQVKETEYRVNKKHQQLQKNFDSQQIEALMEEHSPRMTKNRVRVFWQEPTSNDQ